MITAYKIDGTDSAVIEDASGLALLGEGWTLNQAECAPPPPPPVPESVSPRQIRRALDETGLRDIVDNAIANGTRAMRTDWEWATEIRRDWPMIDALAGQLNISNAQVNDLFRLAATFK